LHGRLQLRVHQFSWIGGHWLAKTLEFFSDQITSMDLNIWFNAQYQATFFPAILSALGFTALGAAFMIWGTCLDYVIGVAQFVLGGLMIIVCMMIISMRTFFV
jgi:hypothetical protein